MGTSVTSAGTWENTLGLESVSAALRCAQASHREFCCVSQCRVTRLCVLASCPTSGKAVSAHKWEGQVVPLTAVFASPSCFISSAYRRRLECQTITLFSLVGLEIEFRALCVPGKHSTTELCLQPLVCGPGRPQTLSSPSAWVFWVLWSQAYSTEQTSKA